MSEYETLGYYRAGILEPEGLKKEKKLVVYKEKYGKEEEEDMEISSGAVPTTRIPDNTLNVPSQHRGYISNGPMNNPYMYHGHSNGGGYGDGSGDGGRGGDGSQGDGSQGGGGIQGGGSGGVGEVGGVGGVGGEGEDVSVMGMSTEQTMHQPYIYHEHSGGGNLFRLDEGDIVFDSSNTINEPSSGFISQADTSNQTYDSYNSLGPGKGELNARNLIYT